MLGIKNRRIMQIGYVVRDIEKSARDYSQRLGIGPWEIYTTCAPDLRDAIYRGKPIDHKFIIAIVWNQTTQLELIQPVSGKNIYTDYLDRHGDGFHHVKEWVDDCQKTIEEFRARGVEVIQSGKYDEDEHYYFDTEAIFGYVYEIGNNGKIRPPERLIA
jgi:glyoxalase/bleomycin resistance protein/dioxygenase superfamily protein